ncbi:MAG TPA: AAA family ATPase [Bacilli bacterium]|nr:AAA family ATPase [Bacilli bacterium]
MISDAHIDLNGLTVIAGENNTGKSTVGKLLFSMVKAFNMTMGRRRFMETAKQEVTLKRVLSLVFDQYACPGAEVSVGANNSDLYSMKINQTGWMDITGTLANLNFYDATYLESPVVWSLVDFFKAVGLLRDQDEMYGFASEIKYPYLLWDTYQKLELEKPFNFEKEDEYQAIEDYIQKTVGGKISRQVGKFLFTRDFDGVDFPVTTVATGIKSFGLLQVLVKNRHINPNSIVIIDEPEVHLHPKWEVDFAYVISCLVKLGVNVVVTTHSVYMVKALREFSKDTPDKVKFYLSHQTDGAHSMFEDVTGQTHKIFKKFADPLQDIVWGKPNV